MDHFKLIIKLNELINTFREIMPLFTRDNKDDPLAKELAALLIHVASVSCKLADRL